METSVSQPSIPTSDERTMAALAHISAVLPFTGIIVPIIIWVTQKEKSRYVRFQALQATAYQLTMILAWLAGMVCYMGSFFVMFGGLFAVGASSSGSQPPGGLAPVLGFAGFILPFAIFGLMFIGGTLFVIYAIVGAIQVVRGKSFYYWIIGKWIERYLADSAPKEPVVPSAPPSSP